MFRNVDLQSLLDHSNTSRSVGAVLVAHARRRSTLTTDLRRQHYLVHLIDTPSLVLLRSTGRGHLAKGAP